jgi:hypothetical protein
MHVVNAAVLGQRSTLSDQQTSSTHACHVYGAHCGEIFLSASALMAAAGFTFERRRCDRVVAATLARIG